MRSLFLTMFFCSAAVAAECTTFEDRAFRVFVQIPNALSKSWEVAHIPTGAKLDIYYSGKRDEEFCLLLVGKMPLSAFDCEEIHLLYPLIRTGIESMLEGEGFSNCGYFDLEVISQETRDDLNLRSYHLRITHMEEGIGLPIDIHVFHSDVEVLVVLMATSPSMDGGLLGSFSRDLIGSVERGG